MSETKREKFVRLAENRVNNALKQIQLISNLSNTSAYDYDKDDIDLIVKTLKNAVYDLEKSFRSETTTSKFSLKK